MAASSTQDTTVQRRARTAPPASSTKTSYLIAYNLVSAGLWTFVLQRVLAVSAVQSRPRELYDDVGFAARWIQTVALLEIGHALFGIVRAPVATTALQVASRVILIWWIVESFPAVRRELAYSTMLLAWSVTEVVRYSYFVLSLSGSVPSWLVWLRYNLFFVLYPLGIGSEVWLVVAAIPHAFKQSELLGYVLYVIVGIYVPGSYILYTHMMAQRRRVLRGKARAKE